MYIKTEFEDLDNLLSGGLLSSSLVVIGSRPAMGKTALSLCILSNILKNSDIECCYISLSENQKQLMHKLICMESEVELSEMNDNINQIGKNCCAMSYQRIIYARHMLRDLEEKKLNYYTDKLNSDQVLSLIEDLAQQGKKIFFLDYLQLFCRGEKDQVYHITSDFVNNLKVLTIQYEITIIVLSQLSRKVEERAGHRPMMPDLRDCGCIEDAADQIFFLLRREYYDPMDKPGMAELIIAKNRHGNVGSVNLTFRKYFGQFVSYKPIIYDQKLDEEFCHFTNI